MNGILALTDLVLETTELTAEQREHLRVVHRSATSLLALVNGILDLAKIESGKMEAALREFDLREEIEDNLLPLRTRAEQRGLTLLLEVDPGVPSTIWSEPAWVRQILLNLVGNAIKFTQRGRVTVTVTRQSEARPGGASRLHISVSDTGVGIPADRLERVFEAFTQADDSIATQFGGTGLGLAICRELARRLDGKIWAESAPGEGTTFHVLLPLYLHAPDARAA
ncbi:MAG: ATP-binding protein [Candidatus Eisenbacteria bacterium]